MKVLHIALREGGGGPADLVEIINQGFAEAGIDVTMVYLRQADAECGATCADKLIGLGLAAKLRPLFYWLACQQLTKILKDGEYDVVLSHRYKPCMLLMKLIRKFPSTHFVNVVHGTVGYNRPSRKRSILKFAHERFHFVGVSEAVAEFISKECEVWKTDSSSEVIPNGIDIQALDAAQLNRKDARQKLGLDDDAVWIGFAGRLVPVKGLDPFIRGFSRVAGKYPNAKLCVLGDGELRGDLQRLAWEQGVQNRVKFVGHVPQAHKYFKAFDAFALPSFREGLSIALLEAMASRLPLIISDIPMSTAVADPDSIVFAPGDVDSIERALVAFLEKNNKQRERNGRENRSLVERKYDIRIFKKSYVDLVRRFKESEKDE